MSHKTWLTKDAWTGFANCGGDSRFLSSPDKLSDDDVEDVTYKCFKCAVRPECIAATVEPICPKCGRTWHNIEEVKDCKGSPTPLHSTGVWCASRFLPEVYLDDPKTVGHEKLAEAERIREELAGTIEDELKRRGEF